ncbi:MAG: glucose-6-phosphate isomerase [candidate division KSB1 bacterium]|nr:glucose-6-phosphate isomerase [candidate division KSB1 bacterium]
MVGHDYVLKLGNYELECQSAIEQLREQRIIERIWELDYTVWKSQSDEIVNRLGWLQAPSYTKSHIPSIESFIAELRNEGMTHGLLLGMGGSSLAPEVFRSVFGVKPGYLDLAVLDSTVPDVVLTYARRLDPKRTLVIASTKSGGTVETISFTKYFYAWLQDALGDEKAGQHFIAITDPGSGLETLAREWQFRKIFLNDPNIGGRFSALSLFGMVPAALIGVDIEGFLKRADRMAQRCQQHAESNPGAILGAVIGKLAQLGRDKLTFLLSPELIPLGGWIEQLIAESTGKEGRGIVPIIGEAELDPTDYAPDRLFVLIQLAGENGHTHRVNALVEAGHPVIEITLDRCEDLAGELFRWEMATAIACYFLEVNPFDQPNVESSKVAARQMIASYRQSGRLPEMEPTAIVDGIKIWSDASAKNISDAIKRLMDHAQRGENGLNRSYVAIQSFMAPSSEMDASLHKLRTAIQQSYRLATTVGYGPRFLHSTGQLHKGDAGNGLFIQITAPFAEDTLIPEPSEPASSHISFGTLALAQALGDFHALRAANRNIVRFHLSNDVIGGIKKIIESIRKLNKKAL